MDHKEQHHEHHQKEREEKKKEQKEHEDKVMKTATPIHPGWLMAIAFMLILAAVFIWTFLIH